MPATDQDPGGCGCPSGTTCNANFLVIGCGAHALTGATVSVAGGGSGTTDGSGRVTLNVGTTGAHTVTVSASRFTTATVTRTVAFCGADTPEITLSAADGYHCFNPCVVPLPDTLHTTLAAPEDVMTFSPGQWQTTDGLGNHRYNLQTDGNMTFDLGICGTGSGVFSVTSCPPSFLGTMLCGPGLADVGNVTE